MSILDRIQRIAKANLNWLLDKLEPAEQELESKIKELEEAITEGKAAAATFGATYRRLEKEANDLKAKQDEFQQNALAAVKSGDDETARKFLAEKVRLEERITNLTPGVEDGRKTYDHLRDNLAKLQDQLKQAKLKLAELRSRQRAAEARKTFGQSMDTVASSTANGGMFERLEDDVLQAEAEADITQDMHSDIDLEQRSRDLQIETELAELKQQVNPIESE